MKVCYICGMKASARMNGDRYLCKDHAYDCIAESLKSGNPVVMAVKGQPQYLVAPDLITISAAEQSKN